MNKQAKGEKENGTVSGSNKRKIKGGLYALYYF